MKIIIDVPKGMEDVKEALEKRIEEDYKPTFQDYLDENIVQEYIEENDDGYVWKQTSMTEGQAAAIHGWDNVKWDRANQRGEPIVEVYVPL